MTESDVATLMRAYIKRAEEEAVAWLSSGNAEDLSEYKRQCGKIQAYRDVLSELGEIEEKLLAE